MSKVPVFKSESTFVWGIVFIKVATARIYPTTRCFIMLVVDAVALNNC
jgi:hypothetical protein